MHVSLLFTKDFNILIFFQQLDVKDFGNCTVCSAEVKQSLFISTFNHDRPSTVYVLALLKGTDILPLFFINTTFMNFFKVITCELL